MKSVDALRKGYAGLNAGDWIGDLPYPGFAGVRLKVRRIGNPDWLALRAKMAEEKTDLSEEANDKRIADAALVSAVLVGWDGIAETYTPELGATLLADPEFGPAFRNAIYYAANALGERFDKQLEADAGN